MKRLILLSFFIVSSVANAQGCFGEPQPKTVEMLQAFDEVKLPYTYVPASVNYDADGNVPRNSLEFSKKYALQLKQIIAVGEWQSQDKNSLREELDVIKNRITITEENSSVDERYFLPLFRLSLPDGKAAIAMRVLPLYSESTEETWVAVLCSDGRVQKVSDIEPGSMRSDIEDYIYTVKSIINADMTVSYWRNILKDGADIGGQAKPYDKGKINLLE